MSGIVSFLSDFGLRDPYVGEMKARILGVNPVARPLMNLTVLWTMETNTWSG